MPARRVADNQRTPYVTLICAICPGVGLVHSKILLGGAKQTHFDQFISELFHLSFGLALEPSSSVDTAFIVLDNAPCHRGIENRLEAYIPSHIELKRLPPSPPSDRVVLPKSKILYKTNSQCSRTIISIEGQTMLSARRDKLLQLCPNALAQITPATCLNSFYHVLTATVPRAIRLENL